MNLSKYIQKDFNSKSDISCFEFAIIIITIYIYTYKYKIDILKIYGETNSFGQLMM